MNKATRRFFSEARVEVPSVTAAQMREIDRIAMEETGPNLFQMMENAGRNLAMLALEVLGRSWEKAKIVVLAGTGGNGGGGICAARHLANRQANVSLCLTNPNRVRQVPAFQRKIFQSTGGREVKFEDLQTVQVDLIIDALIGYNLKSAPKGQVVRFIQWANATNTLILSLDIPSGIDATTGETLGGFIKPKLTMTLALPKTGLISDKTGGLYLADIGIPEQIFRRLGLNYTPPFRSRFWVGLTCE